jgi:hypothetical protein
VTVQWDNPQWPLEDCGQSPELLRSWGELLPLLEFGPDVIQQPLHQRRAAHTSSCKQQTLHDVGEGACIRSGKFTPLNGHQAIA